MNKSSIWVCVAVAHAIVLVAVVFQGCGKTTKPLKVDPPPLVMPGVAAPTNALVPAAAKPSVSPAPSRIPEPEPKPVAVKTATHTVASGESMETIARKYGVRVSELSELNKIKDPKKLRVGQKLVIPGAGEEAGGASAVRPETKSAAAATSAEGEVSGEGTVHVVKAGDSLGKIAARYGTTSAAIRNANKMKSDVVRVGQKLVIPAKGKDVTASGQAPVAAKPAPVAKPAAVKSEVVSPVVATNAAVKASHRAPAKEKAVKKPAVEASSVKAAAPVERTDLQVMTLHDVQANEDLAGVAMTYGVKADDIRKLNGLGQEPIRPGQRLKIPVP